MEQPQVVDVGIRRTDRLLERDDRVDIIGLAADDDDVRFGFVHLTSDHGERRMEIGIADHADHHSHAGRVESFLSGFGVRYLRSG